VIFEDEKGVGMYRKDVTKDEIKSLKDPHEEFYKIWRTFNYTDKKPYKYIVWPYSEKHEWCNKIVEVIYK